MNKKTKINIYGFKFLTKITSYKISKNHITDVTPEIFSDFFNLFTVFSQNGLLFPYF